MIAEVTFPRTSFNQKYSYITDISNLKENDLVLVQVRDGYSVAYFKNYTEKNSDVATAWIVKNLSEDIEEFENKLMLM